MLNYKDALKARAKALRQSGLSQTEIAKEMGVPQQTVCWWLKTPITQNGYEATVTHSVSPIRFSIQIGSHTDTHTYIHTQKHR